MLIPCLHLRSPRFLFLFLSAPLEELLMVLTLVVYCQLDAVVYWKDGTSRSKLISYMITQSCKAQTSNSASLVRWYFPIASDLVSLARENRSQLPMVVFPCRSHHLTELYTRENQCDNLLLHHHHHQHHHHLRKSFRWHGKNKWLKPTSMRSMSLPRPQIFVCGYR